MRIVVVGATGNIGTALLRAIAQRQTVTSVDAVSRRGPGRLPDLGGVARVRHHWLDVAGPDSSGARALADIAIGADAVVHLAWSAERSATAATAANVAITRSVLRAATRARHLVVASCASVYAASFGDEPRDETWPTTGIADSPLSLDKVGLERLVDEFSNRHPRVVVTRLRPAITLQEAAGAELVRRHAGLFLPRVGLGEKVPLLLWPEGLGLQVAHADDVAAALVSAVERRVPGAFNVASPEVLDGEQVAEAIGAARLVEVSRSLARTTHRAAWWAHLVRARPEWLDTLAGQPVLDTTRARDLLGVVPTWSAADVLATAARGVAQRREGWTPALSRHHEPAQEAGEEQAGEE
ncbi:MAG TPA: epimerase [Micrococcales bacterium]|uniref:NAD-dependent epimerase/dehydratase family protein n=1 Tax=Miniimonas arenae TaxID=676201 RepID=A0A5C5BEV5_9MICO|nr:MULTISPECIES: NAD-dependent epimerase/dehydratase family protein [Miniimonas]TNU76180.1 NAD-dependent epimerase/dehydratase family protein [Miniimonas arenae]HCX85979.1 epimerase [Micrococcales bacterium]